MCNTVSCIRRIQDTEAANAPKTKPTVAAFGTSDGCFAVMGREATNFLEEICATFVGIVCVCVFCIFVV